MPLLKYILYLFSFLVFFGCNNQSQKLITIAAAANMQYVVKELINEFKKENTTSLEIVLGSSGKLTAQIEAGAPFDIFLSADAKYPDYLIRKMTTLSPPKTYAYGKLAVFTNHFKLDSLSKILTSTEVKKIALPNPKTAPYGEMTKEYLLNLGVYSQIEHKLVYGENVMQSNQFVISGAADIGFTAISTLNTKNTVLKNMHKKILNTNLYTPIEQQFIIINNTPITQQFGYFMLSDKAQNILKKYGYGNIE